MVTDDVIRQYGGEPVSLDKAFTDGDAVLIINDHPDYRALEVAGGARRDAAGARSTTRGGCSTATAVTARRRPLRRSRLPPRRRPDDREAVGMRALLLGGAGFIGLHLARRLVADGHAGDDRRRLLPRPARTPTWTRCAADPACR